MVKESNFRYLFIVNPKAGKGRFKKLIPMIKNWFPKTIPYDIAISQFPGEARDMIRKRFDEYDVFVAAGGDGTVNEISAELINTDKYLGVLPIGSGNGLARSMGIPLNYWRSIRRLHKGTVKVIDSVRVNSRTYINMAGVGFEGTIARKFEDGGKRGIGPYIKMVPPVLLKYKAQNYQIWIDGNFIERKAYTVSIANTTQHGGGAHICPVAEPDDGMIHAVILKPFKYIWILGMAHKLFTRRIHKSKAIEIFDGKKITIKGDNLCFHMDGEPVELGNELNFEVIPNSISIIC